MSNLSKHQELAIWALRYIKHGDAIKDFMKFQKAMDNMSDSELDKMRKDPVRFLEQHLSNIDSAITWVQGKD